MTPRWNSVWSRDRVDQCSLTKEVQELDSWLPSTPDTLPNSHPVDPTQSSQDLLSSEWDNRVQNVIRQEDPGLGPRREDVHEGCTTEPTL